MSHIRYVRSLRLSDDISLLDSERGGSTNEHKRPVAVGRFIFKKPREMLQECWFLEITRQWRLKLGFPSRDVKQAPKDLYDHGPNT